MRICKTAEIVSIVSDSEVLVIVTLDVECTERNKSEFHEIT